jgi:hypothetical protein
LVLEALYIPILTDKLKRAPFRMALSWYEKINTASMSEYRNRQAFYGHQGMLIR